MPVISAILITVVVLAVWLAGLAVVLRGYFRAIPNLADLAEAHVDAANGVRV
jgi:hypothetical protein